MKKIFYSIVALALMASCNNDDNMPQKNKYISISASIGKMTRVATEGNASIFETNDQISVFAWTGAADEVPAERVVDGSINTYNGSNWIATPQMLWADIDSEHYFLAVYPSHEITDFKADPYKLDTDNQENSDLMIAVNNGGLTAQNNPVELVFDHAMAKIVVNLKFRNQWGAEGPTVESVILKGHTEATIDYMAKTVTGSKLGEITLPSTTTVGENDMTCTSIVIPSSDTKTICIRIDGKDYEYNHDSFIPLNSGEYTTINLNVGRDAITLAGISVNPWTEGETIDDGEAEEII